MYFTLYSQGVQFRWNLRAANHKILADSGESYHNKSDCLHSLNQVNGKNGFPTYDRTVEAPQLGGLINAAFVLRNARGPSLLGGFPDSVSTPSTGLLGAALARGLRSGK